MTAEVSNLSFCRGLKQIRLCGETVSVFSFSPSISLSMLSGCQTPLRGLEGSVPPLQSHPLWQYLATPFIYIHTFKNTCTHRLAHLRVGEWARIRPQRVSCGCGKRGNGWMEIWGGMKWVNDEISWRSGDRTQSRQSQSQNKTHISLLK